MRKHWMPFEEARAFARSLHLRTHEDWIAWSKTDAKPKNIPANPYGVYKDCGWVSWLDWLGNDYLSYTEARDFVRKLHLRNQLEWQKWAFSSKRPRCIPTEPYIRYASSGWVDWHDWLRDARAVRPSTRRKVGLTYDEAKAKVQLFGMRTLADWQRRWRNGLSIEGVPYAADIVYEELWESWEEFLTGDTE